MCEIALTKADRGYRSYGRQSFAALDGVNLSLAPEPSLVSGYQVVRSSFEEFFIEILFAYHKIYILRWFLVYFQSWPTLTTI